MLKIRDSISVIAQESGAVIFDQRSGTYYQVNAVGARLIELLQQGLSEQEIVEKIASEMDADPDEVSADLASFILVLKKVKWVK